MKLLRLSLLMFVTLLVHSNALMATGWSPPVDVSTSGLLGDSVSGVGVDPAGNAVAVWVDNDTVNAIIFASTQPFGGAWTAPVQVSASGSNAREPSIAVDANGNAVAVWDQFSGATYQVLSSTLTFGSAVWTAPKVVSATSTLPNFFPQVAVDGAGNAYAIWSRFDGAQQVVESSTLPFGGIAWTSPLTVSDNTQDAVNPQIAVTPSGNAVAVWNRFDGANQIVQSASLPFGALAWTSPVDLSAIGNDATVPRVSINASGYAVAVWQRFNGTNTVIQSSTLQFGGAWSPFCDNLSPSPNNATAPDVAVDGSGNAVAVWILDTVSIQYATLPAGSSCPWTSAVTLSTGVAARFPRVVMNSNGLAIAIWSLDNGGGNESIQSSFLLFGGAFSAPVNVDTSAILSLLLPRVAITPSGYAVGFWAQNFEGPQFVRSAFFTFTSLSPVNVTGKQKCSGFLTQTRFLNVIQWEAPTGDPQPVLYLIYRDAALTQLIATVPADGELKFVDNGRKKGVVYTYFIVAVDPLGNVSTPVGIAVQPTRDCGC